MAIDIGALCNSVVVLLAEHSAELNEVGWKIPQGIALAGGQALFRQIVTIWEKLRQNAANNKDLSAALSEFQANPKGEASRNHLCSQLQNHLNRDPLLANEFVNLLGSPVIVSQTVKGKGNIVAGANQRISKISQHFGK